jgi:AmmeMemoRadiSam system protein B
MTQDRSLQYPHLRWPIDLRLEKVQDQEILLVSCPLGISATPLGLIAAVAPIVSSFDGTRSIDEIQKGFASYGITVELIRELVRVLDDNLFLHGPRFMAAQKSQRDDFARLDVRPSSLAGLGYPGEREPLLKFVDSYLAGGLILPTTSGRKLLGLKSPHIDYHRGGEAYGLTYRHLHGHQHDLYLLMGTAHQYSKQMFHLTRKDFANPLGLLPCDRPFVDKLASLYGAERSFADEILHRKEHSLELQVPFLRRMVDQPQIVPILVGSFYGMLQSGKLPSEDDQYENFAAALAECLSERRRNGQKICFIAGVDMAHVGKHFGDADALTPDFMREVERRDRQYLDCVVRHDKRGLFAHIEEDMDIRKICGFPTMYLMLDVLERLGIQYEATIYDYRQAVNYATDCAVTFAGVGFHEGAAQGAG